MYSLSVSDFDKQFEIAKPTVKSESTFIASLCNTSIVKYIVFKRVIYLHEKTLKRLDQTILKYKSNQIKFADPKNFKQHINKLINEYVSLSEDVSFDDYFSEKQSKQIKLIVSTVIKKMIKLESIALKESIKDKPKADDSHLINLVMNNNAIEFKKNIFSK